jgi:PAS domain S-box-containing protein
LREAAAETPSSADLTGLEAVLRGVFDTFPAVVTVKDRAGRFLYVNAFHAGLYGTTPDRIVGRTAKEMLGDNYTDGPGELDDQVIATGEAIPFFEQVFAAGAGGPRHWLATKIPLRDGEAVVGVTTIALDIEDRKKLEAALLETKKAAEAASQAKTLFLAQVSHELRTPLNAIIGFTEMMTQEIFGPMGAPQYRGYAQDVLKAARHLLGIITDMLDVTRLDAGALALDLSAVPPGETVTEAARMVALHASTKRVQLRHYVELGLPPLKADARRLRQALINLISNAVKFTPEGGTVSFGARRTAEGGIELYVEDNGIGMSAEDVEVALTVFGRVREGYARSQEGTGIGLPLAKALIERHGGRFTIDSAPGRGTKIRAIFPPACLAYPGAG